MKVTHDQLRQLRVFTNQATFEAPVWIEPPVLLSGSIHSCQIGAFSVLNGSVIGGMGGVTSIGRYCQTAKGSQIGVGGHPTNWLSTHIFQYRDHFELFPRDHPANLFEKYQETENTTIGSDTWVGCNATIMSGVTIGPGAIIGAGAVVLKDVPPYAIVGGVPAKLIRYRFSDEIIERLLNIRWWEFKHADICILPFNDINACLDILDLMILEGRVIRQPQQFISINV